MKWFVWNIKKLIFSLTSSKCSFDFFKYGLFLSLQDRKGLFLRVTLITIVQKAADFHFFKDHHNKLFIHHASWGIFEIFIVRQISFFLSKGALEKFISSLLYVIKQKLTWQALKKKKIEEL